MEMICEHQAFVSKIGESKWNQNEMLVFSDWLEENGRFWEAKKWRFEAALPGIFRTFYRDIYGYGYGNGYGNGYGYGNGNGDGYGDGNGNGNGYGYGYGNGDIQKEQAVVYVGGKFVFMCPGWYVYAGEVLEQTGPYDYLLKDAIMVINNGGHGWGAWAAGTRTGSRVQRCGDKFEVGGPYAGKYELIGEVPLAGKKTFDMVTL
jgi:hypothetical protein